MLTNSVSLKYIYPKIKFKEQQENLQNNSNNTQKLGITSLNNMPDYSYLVSFCGNNENMGSLYAAYKDEMPDTLRKSCEAKSEKELKQITDVYAYYNNVYADMDDCTTVEALKEKFPVEFENLKSALDLDIKRNQGSFLSKIQDLSTRRIGENLFPERGENDLSVYLAKKVFFEVKTKEEIEEDFRRDINKNLHPDVLEYLKSNKKNANNEKGLIPDNVYSDLGLRLPKEKSYFRSSLLRSRKEFITKNKSCSKAKRQENVKKDIDETFERLIKIAKKEKVEDGSHAKNKEVDPRKRFAMYLAWASDDMFQFRVDYSKFCREMKLKEGLSDDELSIDDIVNPDFIDLANNPETKKAGLLAQFWLTEKGQDYRAKFSEAIIKAYDVVDLAMIEGTFENLKAEILSTRAKRKEEFEADKKLEEEKLTPVQNENEFQSEFVKEISDFINRLPIPEKYQLATIRRLASNLDSASSAEEKLKCVEENMANLVKLMHKTLDNVLNDKIYFKQHNLKNSKKKLMNCVDKYPYPLNISNRNVLIAHEQGILASYLHFMMQQDLDNVSDAKIAEYQRNWLEDTGDKIFNQMKVGFSKENRVNSLNNLVDFQSIPLGEGITPSRHPLDIELIELKKKHYSTYKVALLNSDVKSLLATYEKYYNNTILSERNWVSKAPDTKNGKLSKRNHIKR